MKHLTEKNYLFIMAILLMAGPAAIALAWVATANNGTELAKYPLGSSWGSDEDPDDHSEEDPNEEPNEPDDEPEEPDDEPEEPDDEPNEPDDDPNYDPNEDW